MGKRQDFTCILKGWFALQCGEWTEGEQGDAGRQFIQRSGKVLARRSQETWRRGQLPRVFPELERTRFVDLEG